MIGMKWAVVSTCAEPRKLVEAFIAHHLMIGASEIFIFFDDHNDGLAEAFSAVPKVTCINCDATYWERQRAKKGRPTGHRQRQTFNAEYAARHLCESDWIAHIDIDEFLLARSAQSISEMLRKVPDSFDAVRIQPAERMFNGAWRSGRIELSGVFKLKPEWGSGWGSELYGEYLGNYFPNGFQGHEVGKSFKRTSNRQARFNIHFIRNDGENIPEYVVDQEEAVLLHMFPVSYEDWVGKYERRIDDAEYFESMPEHAKRRYSVYGKIRDTGADLKDLFESLSVLPIDSQARIKRPDLFLERDIDPKAGVDALVRPYLSTSHFEHVSQPSHKPVPENKKIFQIGMNRAGSKEISSMFGRRGMSYAHWDRGRLARNLQDAISRGGVPFVGYERYQLISDISYGSRGAKIYDGFYDFTYISKFYRNSIFLLNHRPVDEWLASRQKFRDGKYIAEHMSASGITSEQDMLSKWAEDWHSHAEKVRQSAALGEIRLIEYSLNTEKPTRFFARLEQMLKHEVVEPANGE